MYLFQIFSHLLFHTQSYFHDCLFFCYLKIGLIRTYYAEWHTNSVLSTVQASHCNHCFLWTSTYWHCNAFSTCYTILIHLSSIVIFFTIFIVPLHVLHYKFLWWVRLLTYLISVCLTSSISGTRLAGSHGHRGCNFYSHSHIICSVTYIARFFHACLNARVYVRRDLDSVNWDISSSVISSSRF